MPLDRREAGALVAPALLLVGGGLAAALAHVLHPMGPPAFTAEGLRRYADVTAPVHVLLLIGGFCAVLALPVVHAAQHRRAGALGLLAVAALAVGTAGADLVHGPVEIGVVPALVRRLPPAQAMAVADAIFTNPAYAALQRVGGLLHLAGAALLAVVAWRAAVLWRWPSGLLLAYVALMAVAFVPGAPDLGHDVPLQTLFYLALAGYGAAVVHSVVPRVVPGAARARWASRGDLDRVADVGPTAATAEGWREPRPTGATPEAAQASA